MKDLDEISRMIEEAREILKKISDGHMGAEVTHARVRNLLSIAEQELKFHELDKADKASEQLIEVVRTLETTARILNSAMIKAELFARAQENQTNTMTFWTKVMAGATFVVALATIGYTITSFLQWNILSKQLELSHVDQRPWLGIKAMNPPIMSLGQPFKVDAMLVNTGKTPALNEKIKWAIVDGTKSLDVDKISKSTNYTIDTSESVIYPNVEMSTSMGSSYNLSKDKISAIKAGKDVMYILGTINYTDIFGNLHATNYCGFYAPETDGFSVCGQHNDAN
jgi:hypothetical protein